MIFECLNEKIYSEKLDNGLQVILIPKKGGIKKYAAYATHFGSLNYEFKSIEDSENVVVPDGIAHFLEHKLFEQEDGVNALDKLTKMGANPNAYTSFNHTSYLFECTENFYEVLKALMQFVQNPYLTEENVEKEKGIIGQEIQMYDDDPSWQLFFGFLNSIYKSHAITKDIAGTVESISKITKDILYKCYNTFYDPSNMVLCVCGDIDIDETLRLIKENVKEQKIFSDIDRFYGEDESKDIIAIKEKIMDIGTPMFMMGFRDLVNTKSLKAGLPDGLNDTMKYDVAMQILLEMLVGQSSDLYEKLYNEGLITKELSMEFSSEENYAFSAISGETNNVNEVVHKINERIKELKKDGLNEADFERTKKMLYGRFVRGFEDVSMIANLFINDFFRGVNSSKYVDVYKNIDKEYVEYVMNNHFDFKMESVSIIKNKE